MIKRITQRKGSASCVACVAAMATGTNIDEFRKVVKRKRGPYSDFDFYWYLLYKGYTVGVGFDNEKEPVDFHADATLELSYDIRSFPAYVVVPSETRPGKIHAVYWDGRWIRDPNPEKKDKEDVANYRVLRWFPINKMEKENPNE